MSTIYYCSYELAIVSLKSNCTTVNDRQNKSLGTTQIVTIPSSMSRMPKNISLPQYSLWLQILEFLQSHQILCIQILFECFGGVSANLLDIGTFHHRFFLTAGLGQFQVSHV